MAVVEKIFQTQSEYAGCTLDNGCINSVQITLNTTDQKDIALDWRGRWFAKSLTPLAAEEIPLTTEDPRAPGEWRQSKVPIHVRLSIKARRSLRIDTSVPTGAPIFHHMTMRERAELSLWLQTIVHVYDEYASRAFSNRPTAVTTLRELFQKGLPCALPRPMGPDIPRQPPGYGEFVHHFSREKAGQFCGHAVSWSKEPRCPRYAVDKFSFSTTSKSVWRDQGGASAIAPTCVEMKIEDNLRTRWHLSTRAAWEKTGVERERLLQPIAELPLEEKWLLLDGEIRFAHEYIDGINSSQPLYDGDGSLILPGPSGKALKEMRRLYKDQSAAEIDRLWGLALKEVSEIGDGSAIRGEREKGDKKPEFQRIEALALRAHILEEREYLLASCHVELQYVADCLRNLNESLKILIVLLSFPELRSALSPERRKDFAFLIETLSRSGYPYLNSIIPELETIMRSYFTPSEWGRAVDQWFILGSLAARAKERDPVDMLRRGLERLTLSTPALEQLVPLKQLSTLLL